MQGFASFHEEWNSIPASIVDEQNRYIKGWGYTVIGHCLIFSVPKVLDATTYMALLLTYHHIFNSTQHPRQP
jgi:hypothetical protein